MIKEAHRKIAVETAQQITSEFYSAPYTISADEALEHLSNLLFNDPEHSASKWYATASRNQLDRFRSDWNLWCKQESDAAFEHMQTKGAATFGLDWLRMNMCVRDAAIQQHLDYRAQRTLLTAIAFECCKVFARQEAKT